MVYAMVIAPVFDIIIIATIFHNHSFPRFTKGNYQRKRKMLIHFEKAGKFVIESSNPTAADPLFHRPKQDILGRDTKIKLSLALATFQPFFVEYT
jgi:hypothetical protein